MIRREIVFSEEAKTDLERIYQWIAVAAGGSIALNYVERIEKFCLGFDTASERGHRRDDVRPGLRIAGFERRVAIAFMVAETKATILRVFYGGQNWEEKF